MKVILFFLLIISNLAWSRAPLTVEEFEQMTSEEKEDVIAVYQQFFKSISPQTESEKFSGFRFHLIEEAYATATFDCFYAGWPSTSITRSGARLCRSPRTGNPNYTSQASACRTGTMLCQPIVFGDGVCVDVSTQALRNSAYTQCEARFRESGKTTADLVAALSTPEKRASLEELFQTSESVCQSGFQRGSTMCSRLKKKIAEIKTASQGRQALALRRVAESAVTITAQPFHPEVVCPPDDPTTRAQPAADPTSVRRRRCPQPALTGAAPDIATLQPTLDQNNIRIVAGTLTDTRQLQRFLDDFNRFPEPLREEMKRNGSRINLIIGTGVTDDPSWQEEARRGTRPQDWVTTHDGRSWNNIPGSGGSLGRSGTPTRIVINRLYDGHGATSLFLHEYGHTLDSMYGEHAIARSQVWKDTLARDSRSTEFLTALCPANYCADPAHPEESFAELFAYYHACSETRSHLQRIMPNTAYFFDHLTNVRDLLDGRVDMRMPAAATNP